MATEYSYQGVIGGVKGTMLTIVGNKIRGSAFTTPLIASPAEVRDSSRAAIAWRASVKTLEGGDDGEIDLPLDIVVSTKKDSVSLTATIGTLQRAATYDNLTGLVTTHVGEPFEVSIYSWLFFHAAYGRLCDAAEAMRRANPPKKG